MFNVVLSQPFDIKSDRSDKLRAQRPARFILDKTVVLLLQMY